MPSSRPPRAQNKTVSVDELADKLSSISFTNVKGKQKAATPREQKVAAMRAANAASQVLSNFIRSGQKKSAKTLKELSASAISAATHFDTLRELCPLDIDVERAASSVLAKLITLEMVSIRLSVCSFPETHLVRPCSFCSHQIAWSALSTSKLRRNQLEVAENHPVVTQSSPFVFPSGQFNRSNTP